MKFVALVSGGKDSCFNILKCQTLGHELVALANLYPKPGNNDEIDSFMYQTVGYQAVSLFDQLFDVPLYRRPISGTSSNTLEYTISQTDETEDLYMVLKTVVEHHPDVEAVSVGAILSTYQRVRVENVCSRLGLISLAYLWQLPEKDLFYEIIGSGMDVRIIKTAGIGLSRIHLGKSLAELEPELLKLNQLYQLHMCGEGGEYETLVFDGPHFKRKLQIIDMHIVDHSNDDVSYLSLNVRVVDKPKQDVLNSQKRLEQYVKQRPLLDERFELIFDSVKHLSDNIEGNYEASLSNFSIDSNRVSGKVIYVDSGICMTQKFLFLYNLTGSGLTPASQVNDIFRNLNDKLKSYKLSFHHIVFVSLIVSDMTSFTCINQVYKTYFQKPLPPARVCIEADLPHGCLAQMSVSVERKLSTFNSLHVQSRSYWAPANIGPYSQAKTCEEITFLAGQIGLIPSTMQLAQTIELQACLSLQNLYKVIDVMKLQALASCVCYITDCNILPLIDSIWKELTRNKNDDDFAIPADSLIVAQVKQLPRGAAVEWCGYGYKSFASDSDNDCDGDRNGNSDATNEITPATLFKYQLGTNTVYTVADEIANVPLGKAIITTILTTDYYHVPHQLKGEIILATKVFYNLKPVKYAAIIWCNNSL